MLFIHILIASTSLIFSTFLFFSPSQTKLKTSYSLVALTFITGTYLVLTTHSNLLQTCLTGLVYLGITSFATISARQKLTI